MNKKKSRLGADFVMLTEVNEAERQRLLGFHFFIKENDLGTAERRSNMAKRKEVPGRGTRRAKGRKGLNLK